jgi:hypothetical protein
LIFPLQSLLPSTTYSLYFPRFNRNQVPMDNFFGFTVPSPQDRSQCTGSIFIFPLILLSPLLSPSKKKKKKQWTLNHCSYLSSSPFCFLTYSLSLSPFDVLAMLVDPNPMLLGQSQFMCIWDIKPMFDIHVLAMPRHRQTSPEDCKRPSEVIGALLVFFYYFYFYFLELS